MTTLSYKTARHRTEQVTFELDDVVYHFTPPDTSNVILAALDGEGAAVVKAYLDWLGAGLPDDEEEALLARLRDPKDDLDVNLVSEIALDLLRKAAGVPLAEPADSSE